MWCMVWFDVRDITSGTVVLDVAKGCFLCCNQQLPLISSPFLLNISLMLADLETFVWKVFAGTSMSFSRSERLDVL